MSEPVTTRQAAWRQQKPYAYQAHLAVQRAVKKGVLLKPSACSECGTRGKRIDAHHPDYREPLRVQWLCRSCHNRAHAKPSAAAETRRKAVAPKQTPLHQRPVSDWKARQTVDANALRTHCFAIEMARGAR